jgi:hypothetical protein
MNEMTVQEDRLVPEDGGPESLAIAQTYLSAGSIEKTAEETGLPIEVVSQQLQRPEVRAYIATVFSETGFRNKNKIFGLLDTIINEKIKEASETGMVADGTLLDVLETAHKMKIAEMTMEIKLIEAQTKANGGPSTQVNIQSNNYGSEGMNTLLSNLMGGNK